MSLSGWWNKLIDFFKPKPKKQLGCNAQFYLHNINAPDAQCMNGWIEECVPCPECQPEIYEKNTGLKPPKKY